MGYQPYTQAPGTGTMEPPEAQSIRSMLHIVRILAVIFGILLFLGGIAYLFIAYATYTSCAALVGSVCGGLGVVLVFSILLMIWGVVDVIIYLQMKEIEALVDRRQYEQGKSKTLVWMILGFIIGGILLGILLLVAYLKFDPLINWQRSQMGEAYGVPRMGQPLPPPLVAPPAAVVGPPPPQSGGQRFCPSCGSPSAAGAQFCSKCGVVMPR